ncbi:MAG: Holliday junction branch migration protein RuvA [Firmicutes bacterium]|nr:Holliday junction branch migration protein RuvA [Bacillota bacterium]
MISYIKGKAEYIGGNYVIMENNGIGYKIFVSDMTAARIPRDKEIKIYTYMSVREDDISLFGFSSREELNMFNMLIGVSGIGPKGALAILAALSPGDIALAIITDDVKTLSSGQGIGKKTAQRIILELKDKMAKEKDTENIADTAAVTAAIDIERSDEKNDAFSALIMLGFERGEAMKAISAVYEDGMNTEKIVSLALKKLS